MIVLSQSMAGGSEGHLPSFLAALVLIVSRDTGGRSLALLTSQLRADILNCEEPYLMGCVSYCFFWGGWGGGVLHTSTSPLDMQLNPAVLW